MKPLHFTLEVSVSVSCKHCEYVASASAWKWVYMKLLMHLKFRCPEKNATQSLPFFKSLWDLWKLPS